MKKILKKIKTLSKRQTNYKFTRHRKEENGLYTVIMYQSGRSGYKEHEVFDNEEDYDNDDDEPTKIACMNFPSHTHCCLTADQLTDWRWLIE